MQHDPIGTFRCERCGCTFRVEPGNSGCNVRCPKDDHLWCAWLDWRRFAELGRRNRGES